MPSACATTNVSSDRRASVRPLPLSGVLYRTFAFEDSRLAVAHPQKAGQSCVWNDGQVCVGGTGCMAPRISGWKDMGPCNKGDGITRRNARADWRRARSRLTSGYIRTMRGERAGSLRRAFLVERSYLSTSNPDFKLSWRTTSGHRRRC